MPKYHFRPYVRKPFDAEKCTRCGLCLSECPIMHLPKERAKQAIETLVSGGSVPDVERDCVACAACNAICPNDCRPTNMFQDRWYEAYKKEGIPEGAKWFLAYTPPNFRTYIMDRLPATEKAAVTQWGSLDTVPGGEILYPGCSVLTTPYLLLSKLFEGMTVRGRVDACCGEMYFRMGLYDQVEQIAKRVTHYFREILKVKKVWIVCIADLDMFENTLPQFGADFSGIQFENYQRVILQGLESGKWKITNPLSGTVALQDSCHGKTLNAEIFELPRKILEKIGLTVVEPPQAKEAMICCGIGCGFSHLSGYSKGQMMKGFSRAYKNLKAPGAQYLCMDCSGCLGSFSVARMLSLTGRQPSYHLLELVQMATGDTIGKRYKALGRQYFAGSLFHQKGKKLIKLPEIPLIPPKE